MNKKIKCDIYTRVSTTMQVDGYSLDAQKEKLKRYAEFQNMEIVNEYSDEGKSGKSVEMCIRDRYYAPSGDSNRRIEPYYLVFRWSSWYVWGWCLEREDYRLFKLNRMDLSLIHI